MLYTFKNEIWQKYFFSNIYFRYNCVFSKKFELTVWSLSLNCVSHCVYQAYTQLIIFTGWVVVVVAAVAAEAAAVAAAAAVVVVAVAVVVAAAVV